LQQRVGQDSGPAGRNIPAMEQSRAQRRLVKSPPELWAEVSSEPTLRRHLAEFGEIRITRVDPETTVAWEGERASGTVELAPAGWGTKVVLTATLAPAEAAEPDPSEPEPEPEPAPEPEPIAAEPGVAEPVPAADPPAEPAPRATRPRPVRRRRRGLLARLFRRRPPAPAAEIPAPGPPVHDPSPPAPAPDPSPPGPGPDTVPPSPSPDPSPLPPAPDPVPPVPAPDPTPPSIEETELPPAATLGPDRTVAILTGMLDDLGSAHRRIVLHD
jgi:hypothetical protein